MVATDEDWFNDATGPESVHAELVEEVRRAKSDKLWYTETVSFTFLVRADPRLHERNP